MTQASAAQDSCVTFNRVSKRYGELQVLRSLSAALPAAQTTAIVGASGSGKTTLLEMINRLVTPDSGSIEVFGQPQPTTGLEAFRRQIGYSVQGAGLFPHMTIRKNVCLMAQLEGWQASLVNERYAALLDALELPADISERYPHALSGGQQQRVGLCRALMLDPPLLLLDEPFSAIDPITRSEVYRIFGKALRERNVSAVLVTHDMREAVKLADYLLILKDGEVLQAGRCEMVLAEPADDYVRQLVQEQL
ncbi:MAG: ATP-binding cassette domain-containing protein [Pseudomonadales bacterium]